MYWIFILNILLSLIAIFCYILYHFLDSIFQLKIVCFL